MNECPNPEWGSIDYIRGLGNEGRSKIYERIASGDFIAKKAGRRAIINIPKARAFYNALPDVKIDRRYRKKTPREALVAAE